MNIDGLARKRSVVTHKLINIYMERMTKKNIKDRETNNMQNNMIKTRPRYGTTWQTMIYIIYKQL